MGQRPKGRLALNDIAELPKPLLGRWVTRITMLYPPEQAGTEYQAVDTYRWLPGEKVLIHEVEARMEQPVFALEVYTQGPDGAIGSRSFDGGGTVSHYRAEMSGGVWRVTGEAEEFASSLMSEERIEGLWRLKVQGEWVEWMRVGLDRVSGL